MLEENMPLPRAVWYKLHKPPMTEEQKKRLDQRLRELKERLDGKPAPTVKEGALLTELQPGYLEVLMRRFRP